MKFVITESKFRIMAKKHVLDKLNNLKLNKEEVDYNGIRVDYDKTSEISPGIGAFHWEDGVLEVDSAILSFCDPFEGLEGVGDYKIIAKWFEVNYGAEVDTVWEWDDSAHP